MSLVNKIMAYEMGTLDASGTLDLFAELIASGAVWSLQGSYGRAAEALIRNGLITREGVVTERGDNCR